MLPLPGLVRCCLSLVLDLLFHSQIPTSRVCTPLFLSLNIPLTMESYVQSLYQAVHRQTVLRQQAAAGEQLEVMGMS